MKDRLRDLPLFGCSLQERQGSEAAVEHSCFLEDGDETFADHGNFRLPVERRIGLGDVERDQCGIRH